jgi:hypothetical protein
LTTEICLSPGVALTVETMMRNYVDQSRVTLLTVTPGMKAARCHR